jgi:signal transduction histidine kinase
MTRTSAPEDVGTLWLLTLQRAIGRASHDVKDALNGVSVNLEVIRSRAARPDAPASGVAQFADAAAQQLDRLTSLIEAVLALGRTERSPADVAVTLHRVVALCRASASSADAGVALVEGGGPMGSTHTGVHGDLVRLALLAPLLDVVTGTDRSHPLSEVTCTLAGSDDAIHVVIAADGRRATVPDGVADLLRGAGVRWTERDDLSLAFPRA